MHLHAHIGLPVNHQCCGPLSHINYAHLIGVFTMLLYTSRFPVAGNDALGQGRVGAATAGHVIRLTYTGLLPSCSAMEAVQAAR